MYSVEQKVMGLNGQQRIVVKSVVFERSEMILISCEPSC